MDGDGLRGSDQPERELHALLSRLSQGDRSAFQPLFVALWPLLRRFSTRFLSSTADGDDAAQQALLKVFSRSREYDPTRPALPWLLAIATNECRTLRKRHLRRGDAPLHLLAYRHHPEAHCAVHNLLVELADARMDRQGVKQTLG